ncbi:DUF2213 domain-containing protein [Providencia rettgeri]|uniref:DUF2213 domain-containing protein n=1 Tax=Providencia rettgeri TaxID=587 RepID=UPI001010D8C4|nr:DUF2213 domain-containing protein [Providencia rettgeri]RXN73055.1 DUF2213 domain-containing protein [Providencia rettgeri]
MKYFFKTRLGNTRYELADGSLLCKNVPIARTGTQLYSTNDLPKLIPDSKGEIEVERLPEDVFSPETLASFEGMTITLLHPSDDDGNVMFVDTVNWRELAQGHAQNVRRGEGEQSDLMLADLIIKDELAIQEINKGNDEISCGYDAQYEQTAPGKAKQVNIIGNHVALVPNGRAGYRCAIGDSMSKNTQAKSWFMRVLSAHRTKDSAAMQEALDNAPDTLVGDEGTGELPKAININISPQQPLPKGDPEMPTGDDEMPSWAKALVARLDALEGKTTDTGEPDKGKGTQDSDKEDEVNITGDAAYKAELIVPGIDLSKPSKPTEFKRHVLSTADQNMVRMIVGDAEIKKLPKSTVDMAFNAVAEIAKGRNTASTRTADANRQTGNSITDLNKSNADFWANRGK